MHLEVRALFGRFVWRGVNIDDVTIHPSRGSRINHTQKVSEHNRVTHASLAHKAEDNIGLSQTNTKQHNNYFTWRRIMF